MSNYPPGVTGSEPQITGESDTPIADAVAEFDSHGIYDVAGVTKALREAGYSGRIPEGMTATQTIRAIEARGLGGDFTPGQPEDRYIAGFTIAATVCFNLIQSTPPGDQFHGRGTAYRANLAAIRNHERDLF